MNIYCVKCRKDTENIDPKIFRAKNKRLVMQSKCSVCGIKKSRFLKEQESKGLLSNLGIKTPLRKIPLLNVLFSMRIKMNEIINTFLLVVDQFLPEMHLKQPGFTYSACDPFTKNKERIEKFMQTGNTGFIYKTELDKACFQHDMAYEKSKDLIKRTQSDKFLKDKAFKIANNPNYDGYQRGLASMVYRFFGKKSKGSGIINEPNYQLANELHKRIIRKFKKRNIFSSFKDNIWGVDLTDMQSLGKYNKGIKYLLCATCLFWKYAWVIPIKDKKGTSIANAFTKI